MAQDPNGQSPQPTGAVILQDLGETEEAEKVSAPHTLTPEAICGRGEHDLVDGGRAALLRSRVLFESAVRHYPENSCGYTGLARVLSALLGRGIEQDDRLADQALASARRGVELDPASPTAHAALSGALLVLLDTDAAANEAASALALGPASIPALQAQAMVMTATGRHRRGLIVIEKALELGPGMVASHHMKGNLLSIAGEDRLAIVSFRNALSLNPDFMPSTLALAAAYEQIGDLKSSARIFQDVLTDHPEESSRCYLYMGYSLMTRYSWNAALGALEKASFKTRRGLSDGTILFFKAICYERLGRRPEAVAAFREVIDKWPDATIGFSRPERLVSSAYEGLGRIHLSAHEMEAAVSVLEEGAARPDAGPDLLVRLANLYRDYGMPLESASLLERAATSALGPRNADKVMTAYVLWARVARERNDARMTERMTTSLRSRTSALAELGEYVYELDAMRAFSLAGNGEDALAALRRATESGYRQLEWIRQDPDMTALRDSPGFTTLARQVAGSEGAID